MEKLYRNPVRRADPGTGSDRKQIVPESGTQKARLSCVGERAPMSNIDMIL